MNLTGVKVCTVTALASGFNALGYPPPPDNTLDLIPNSITIDYPMTPNEWPAIFVQFRPTKTQWMGLDPDALVTNSGGGISQYREIYFEGNLDLQILAMHSEERDRLYDSLVNLVLMGYGSPASSAFYTTIALDPLVGLTFLGSQIQNLGDTVSPGLPWMPEANELTYENTIRIRCVGEAFEDKYAVTLSGMSAVRVSGQLVTTITGGWFNPAQLITD